MLCTHKRVVWYKTGRFCKNGAILDFTHDTCEMCSLVTRNNWPRVISNHRKLTCVKCFCSSKSVMLARLLLREHFQILGSYFLPHTNTVILLDSYCGIIKETGLFLLGSQTVPRKCESRMGRFAYPWCSARAPESSAEIKVNYLIHCLE